MAYTITPQRIQELKEWLEQYPIDHAYDEAAEYFDGGIPPAQIASRLAYDILKDLGELP